jgi:predicted RNA-binding protein associated with RNAse of E/G family
MLQAGATIVLQEIWRGKVWGARPMRVVEDSGARIALWFPRRTRWKAPTSDPSWLWKEDRGERLAECAVRGEWVYRDAEWDVDTLQFTRPGDRHSIWVSWRPDGEQFGWYVNIQEPFRRTPLGIATMDWVLDLIVDPDGSWRLKDEDELEAFVRRGVYDAAFATNLRDHALELAGQAERREGIFGEPWHDWRPDPDWSLPELPFGWDRPP